MTFPLWLSRPWGLTQSAQEHISEAEATSLAMRNEVQKMVHSEYTETNTYLTQIISGQTVSLRRTLERARTLGRRADRQGE